MMRITFTLFLLLAIGCESSTSIIDNSGAVSIDLAQQEIDEIYTLLAYSVVYKDWQTDDGASARGHNIGSVLVDSNHTPVFWARNANAVTNNGSQHGEVRLIHNFLNCSNDKYLKGYTVYTTLEPCAMCTGMMSLTKLSRTVYGQKDTGYGDALERLAWDSQHHSDGHSPYPRLFESTESTSSFTKDLNRAFIEFSEQTGSDNITVFLRSDASKLIYEKAVDYLEKLSAEGLETTEGKTALAAAKSFLENVSSEYVVDPESICR